MTVINTSICWAVLAPLSDTELQRIAAREWHRDFPYAIDPPPWRAVTGNKGYNALVSPSPGTEGSDRHFAEILSRMTRDRTVYSLWFDPERSHVFEWKNGREVSLREGDPVAMAESLGFSVVRQQEHRVQPYSVAVVEGAAVDEVRRALGSILDEGWLNVIPLRTGVLVTSADGSLGTQAWDVAEALPSAIVYYVQKAPDYFSVLVLSGTTEKGEYRAPPLNDDSPRLADIKGATGPSAVLTVLGITAGTLGESEV